MVGGRRLRAETLLREQFGDGVEPLCVVRDLRVEQLFDEIAQFRPAGRTDVVHELEQTCRVFSRRESAVERNHRDLPAAPVFEAREFGEMVTGRAWIGRVHRLDDLQTSEVEIGPRIVQLVGELDAVEKGAGLVDAAEQPEGVATQQFDRYRGARLDPFADARFGAGQLRLGSAVPSGGERQRARH